MKMCERQRDISDTKKDDGGHESIPYSDANVGQGLDSNKLSQAVEINH